MVDTLLGAAYAAAVVLLAPAARGACPRTRAADAYRGAVPVPLPDWLTAARRICVLTGAGISTDSGIPDYRGTERACGPATRTPRSS